MSEHLRLFAGIDLGTSGVRAVCVDEQLETHASAQVAFDSSRDNRRDPQLWWQAVRRVINEMLNQVTARRIVALAVDGTSGTLLPVNAKASPLAQAQMYNDVCTDKAVLDSIAAHAPATSAVHGATSALARAIVVSREHDQADILHEADWINFQLTGIAGISDENNALKTGYDPILREWPSWIETAGMPLSCLPQVIPAGQLIGSIQADAAVATGLQPNTCVVAGTTDGCASFLATGASKPGDGVSALGSTLTIKLLSDKPVYAPQYGIYSHRIGDRWLAGGASNTGGAVLAKYFSAEDIERLSATIDLSMPTALDYYPLAAAGERFPINDSTLEPRLSPRPATDDQFLHGMLQGIANIEQLAYQRLSELGAPALDSLRSVGGGSKNEVWTHLRHQTLNVPFVPSVSDQAAVGSASLARDGFMSRLK